MPGVYREKQCPVCGITHRRRGPYCSRSHAAQDRTHSAETIQKITQSNKERVADRTSDAYLDAVDNLRDATMKSKGIVRDPIPPRLSDDRPGETIDGDYWVSGDDWY
jgi:hypothetical protein